MITMVRVEKTKTMKQWLRQEQHKLMCKTRTSVMKTGTINTSVKQWLRQEQHKLMCKTRTSVMKTGTINTSGKMGVTSVDDR